MAKGTKKSKWQLEQPFSRRPALFGSFIASTALEDFEAAEEMLRVGYAGNRDDLMIANNLAFACANQGKVQEAATVLSHARISDADVRPRICLTATSGLVAFRRGDPERGRELYRNAIWMSQGVSGARWLGAIARVYHAIEECRAGSPTAWGVWKAASEEIGTLQEPMRSVYLEKLGRAGALLRGE